MSQGAQCRPSLNFLSSNPSRLAFSSQTLTRPLPYRIACSRESTSRSVSWERISRRSTSTTALSRSRSRSAVSSTTEALSSSSLRKPESFSSAATSSAVTRSPSATGKLTSARRPCSARSFAATREASSRSTGRAHLRQCSVAILAKRSFTWSLISVMVPTVDREFLTGLL